MQTSSKINFDQRCQVISDGEQMGLILPNNGVIMIQKPFVRSFSVDTELLEIHAESFKSPIHMVPVAEQLNIHLTGLDYKIRQGSVDLFDFDFFRNMTVRDLLGVIGRKIEER